MKYSEYEVYLGVAKKIVESICGKPKTHRDFCENINKAGDVAKILIEVNQSKQSLPAPG